MHFFKVFGHSFCLPWTACLALNAIEAYSVDRVAMAAGMGCYGCFVHVVRPRLMLCLMVTRDTLKTQQLKQIKDNMISRIARRQKWPVE